MSSAIVKVFFFWIFCSWDLLMLKIEQNGFETAELSTICTKKESFDSLFEKQVLFFFPTVFFRTSWTCWILLEGLK